MSTINFNSKEFCSLSEEKRHFLSQLSKDLENIPSSNAIGYLLAISSKLKTNDIYFTDKEKDLLYQVLTSKMSDKEQQKFNLMRKLIQ